MENGMENGDSPAKQASLDGKGAYAGNVSPDPEIDLEQLGDQAGLNVQPGKPLSMAEDFYKRDQNRYELDVDSRDVEDEMSDDNASDLDQIEIVRTETGQIEAIHTQPVE
jgi:hypothetical protein